MADIISQEELLKIKRAADEAQESDTPFVVVNDGKMAVVGDANKTEINKHNFEITFVVPDGQNGYTAKTVEYEDVWLKPRQAVTVDRLMTALVPLWKNVKPDGKVEDYTDEELIYVAKEFDESVLDIMYDLVARVVGVNDELKDYMTQKSVLAAFQTILSQYPEVAKTAEAFFK